MRKIVLLDACVLYPFYLRDLLVRLAVAGTYRAHWTEMIEEEWTRSLLQNRPNLPPARIRRTVALMNKALPSARFTDTVPTLPCVLPDLDDHHVLAAAVAVGADVLLTFNLRDFPEEAATPYDISVMHPDTFMLDLMRTHPHEVFTVLIQQQEALTSPLVLLEDLVTRLEKTGLNESMTLLRSMFFINRPE